MAIQLHDHSVHWVFPQDANIYQAEALKAELLQVVEHHLPIVCDLSQVSEFDSVGLQMILLAEQASESSQLDFSISKKSELVADSFKLMGVAL